MSTPSVDVRGRCATRDAGVARVGRPGREWRLLAPGIVRARLYATSVGFGLPVGRPARLPACDGPSPKSHAVRNILTKSFTRSRRRVIQSAEREGAGNAARHRRESKMPPACGSVLRAAGPPGCWRCSATPATVLSRGCSPAGGNMPEGVHVDGRAAGLLALQRPTPATALSRGCSPAEAAGARLQRYVLQNPVSSGNNDFRAQVMQASGNFQTAPRQHGGRAAEPGRAGPCVRRRPDGDRAHQPEQPPAEGVLRDPGGARREQESAEATIRASRSTPTRRTRSKSRTTRGRQVKLHRIMPER